MEPARDLSATTMDSKAFASTSTLVKGKGKGRAKDDEFEDLFPKITYRHLLAPVMGVRNLLRVVALCDGDAFYAGREQVRLGLDPSLPLVVSRWNAFIDVNYPARKYGISMDKLEHMRMRCPNLNVVTRKKASLDLYRHENVKIISLFKNEVSTGEAGTIENHFIRRCWKTTMQQKRRLLTKLLLTLPCTPEILHSDDIHISPRFLVTH